MFRLSTYSIRSLLLLITFVVALPAAGIIAYSGIHFRNEMLGDARKETVKLTDRIVSEQQNLVTGAEQLMTALAQLPEVKERDTARVEPILRELRKLNPMYSNIFIADLKGTVWATAVPVKPPFVIADRRYFRNALLSGHLSSGEYVVSRATTMPAFNVAYPLKDDHGAVIGVISVGFVIDQYRQLLERMQLPAGTSFVLIDHQGVVLSRAINPEPYIGKQYSVDEFKKMREGPETGTTVRTGIAGDKRIISYRKLRLAGEQSPYMYVTAGIPVEVAIREANQALMYNMAFLASFLVLACGAAMLIGKRSIMDRFRLLEDASMRLAAGDLQVRVSDQIGGGELGFLGHTFDAMAEELAMRQQALQENQERLHMFLANAPVILYALDKDGRFTFSEGKGLAALGLVSGEVVGQSVFEVYRDAPQILEEVGRALAGETFSTVLHVGEKVFESRYTPLKNDEGEVVGTIGVATDISDRMAAEAENSLLIEQLIQAQKMESIGRLAGGVAHDFNNLLTPIIGFSELLKNDLSDKEAGLAKVGNILKAAEKAKELVQQLLSFSRKQVMEMKTIDLNQAITAFHSILRHTIRESIDIRLCLAEDRYCIRADRNQIEQVIMNLTVNAQDAIAECGAITIETSPVLLDDEYARQHKEVNPGRYLMLSITDDGCGMDQETRQRIFEPFFTTKGVGKGTGLGLATVYGIVRQHGGNIWVYSEPGQGTTFKCYFPIVDETPTSEQPAVHEQVALAGEQRTILVVEDNEMVRKLVGELLTEHGFEVLVAEDPKQALRISEGRSLDLLITDVVMPHMTGPELHARLLDNYPGLRVLYMSGYASNVIVHQGVLDEGIQYIQKPFAITEFMRRVEAMLTS